MKIAAANFTPQKRVNAKTQRCKDAKQKKNRSDCRHVLESGSPLPLLFALGV